MKYAGLYLAPRRSHRVGILRLNEYCISDTERQSVLPVIALGSVAAPTGDGVHHMHLGVCCKRIRQVYSTSMFSSVFTINRADHRPDVHARIILKTS
jgi:hypothetical protein